MYKKFIIIVSVFILYAASPILIAQGNKLVLKNVYKDYFLIGATLNQSQFTGKNTSSDVIVKEQFNSITPENILKWMYIHPEIDKYNFEPTDNFVEFGEKGLFVEEPVILYYLIAMET